MQHTCLSHCTCPPRCLLLQVLRERHQLPEADVQRLYRLLHIYSLGFHQVVGEVTLHASERRQLLQTVWKAFIQLWEDALQVPFGSSELESESSVVLCRLHSCQHCATLRAERQRSIWHGCCLLLFLSTDFSKKFLHANLLPANLMQVSFQSEMVELVQERDHLVAAYMTAQDAAVDMQQQNRCVNTCQHACLPCTAGACQQQHPGQSCIHFSHAQTMQTIKCVSLTELLMHRELHERLRSLVGGAITRMARERVCKGHMAELESQLHLLKVNFAPHTCCSSIVNRLHYSMLPAL